MFFVSSHCFPYFLSSVYSRFINRFIICQIISIDIRLNNFGLIHIDFSFRVTGIHIVKLHALYLLLNGTVYNHFHCNLGISQNAYAFLNFPFNFFALSFASDSMVLLIDNVASGNRILDNFINVLYVSCVSDTFLYLFISVILTFHLFIMTI